MFVLWYCHKRGREERLEREKAIAAGAQGPAIADSERFEELPDDPQLPAPASRSPSYAHAAPAARAPADEPEDHGGEEGLITPPPVGDLARGNEDRMSGGNGRSSGKSTARSEERGDGRSQKESSGHGGGGSRRRK